MNSHRSAVDKGTAQAMDEFSDRLRDANLPPVQRVLLYGSRARGDYGDESDIDIAVVFRGMPPRAYPFDLLERLTWIGYEVALSHNGELHPSPRPVFEGQLADPSSTKNPSFYLNVARDGIEWARMGNRAA